MDLEYSQQTKKEINEHHTFAYNLNKKFNKVGGFMKEFIAKDSSQAEDADSIIYRFDLFNEPIDLNQFDFYEPVPDETVDLQDEDGNILLSKCLLR